MIKEFATAQAIKAEYPACSFLEEDKCKEVDQAKGNTL